ncbi:MAG TPA: DNA-binding protein [Desulfosporosinus sp.]|nr:DNA-binding protein [Desulfosporosinus sp.]
MFPNLNAEMARIGIKKRHIVELLGCTPKTLRSKFSGNSDFTIKEMKKIRDKFFPKLTLDFLFMDESTANNEKDFARVV